MWKVLTATLSVTDTSGQPTQIRSDHPSLADVEALFAQLGHGEGGDLGVEGQPGGRSLAASGGPSRFLVSCMGDDYGAYNLVDPDAAGQREWLTLTVGKMPSAVVAAMTVGVELAVRAIRYFFAHGAIDPDLRWE